MKRLLIIIDWFDPAFKAGGPIRTAVNIAVQLQFDYEIFILTGDRDLNDTEPLSGVARNRWMQYSEEAKVMYLSHEKLNWTLIKSSIKSVKPDIIYCNGMFSRYFTVYPLIMRTLGEINAKLVVGPHGMLRPSALRFKPIKKKIFLSVMRALGVSKRVVFQATDPEETADIKKVFKDSNVVSVLDMPAPLPLMVEVREKRALHLDIIFIGRIHPIKQLDFVLNVLKETEGNICLSIAGIVEDEEYWSVCKSLISGLPENITVSFLGEIKHDEIMQQLKKNHILFLPTLGENFGHAIFEALALGKPVLISDQTPWRNLTNDFAGWDLPLSDVDRFKSVISETIKWDSSQYAIWSAGARSYVEKRIDLATIIDQYKSLF